VGKGSNGFRPFFGALCSIGAAFRTCRSKKRRVDGECTCVCVRVRARVLCSRNHSASILSDLFI
jgi:hypothetical protein